MKAAVITVSDRASRGEYQDLSGPEIEALLEELIPGISIERCIVPDEPDALLGAFRNFTSSDTDPASEPASDPKPLTSSDPGTGSENVPAATKNRSINRSVERPVDVIITTGGTGISPRDITPDITKQYCDKELPGIAEILRARSYQETSAAMLSRGYAGLKGNTLIINFPGSVKAVRLCTRVVAPELKHAMSMLRGGGH